MIATRNDEWTFWLLKEIVENVLPQYHTKNMSGLIMDIDVLTELIKLKMPNIYNHITKIGKFTPGSITQRINDILVSFSH